MGERRILGVGESAGDCVGKEPARSHVDDSPYRLALAWPPSAALCYGQTCCNRLNAQSQSSADTESEQVQDKEPGH